MGQARAGGTIHRGKHFAIQHFRASAYVRVNRSEAPLKSVADAIQALGECRDALSTIDATRHGILFDWRRSPMSTDPELHRSLAELTDALAAPFARRAILLATTVGVMQASRVGRTLGNQKMAIYDDEQAAVEHVTRR
jgi:hypothetical protein